MCKGLWLCLGPMCVCRGFCMCKGLCVYSTWACVLLSCRCEQLCMAVLHRSFGLNPPRFWCTACASMSVCPSTPILDSSTPHCALPQFLGAQTRFGPIQLGSVCGNTVLQGLSGATPAAKWHLPDKDESAGRGGAWWRWEAGSPASPARSRCPLPSWQVKGLEE